MSERDQPDRYGADPVPRPVCLGCISDGWHGSCPHTYSDEAEPDEQEASAGKAGPAVTRDPQGQAGPAQLLTDAERLDFLDSMNARKNVQNGTTYGWKLEENHNRIALSDHNFPALSVRAAIDAAIGKDLSRIEGEQG
ncbi:MAG: hypothetical protein JWR07_1875 [Nevskia sp.]|nr:hypothetical protein [Nevskia sp.]